MKPRILAAAFFSLWLANAAHGWNWLYVTDPRGWEGGQGTIEEAVISVKPVGLYTEIGLYLTFSARGVYFYNADTLEVQFQFELPRGTIVHDSWLWIGDEIVRAEIMDQWTASQIYEDIVRRRRDPSILFKRSGEQYELRIFPMHKNETRKVKITFLAPADWNAASVLTPLPVGPLQASANPLGVVRGLAWMPGEWGNPSIPELPEAVFQRQSDPKFGEYLSTVIPGSAVWNDLHFSCDAPFQNGLYLNRLDQGNGGIYQLAFLPSRALSLPVPARKLAVLLDHVAQNSSFTGLETVQALKTAMHAYCTPADSFNLLCTRLRIVKVSDSWIPADSAGIEAAFAELGPAPLSDYSNLPSLLAEGIDFVKKNGNDGSLVLVSNSDRIGDSRSANELIDDLLAAMDPERPVHVADYQNQNWTWWWAGSRSFMGNAYFYENLTRLTGGGYANLQAGGTLGGLLASLFRSLGGALASFDLHTTLENGFCYARFDRDETGGPVPVDRPVLQTGKFNGAFPFVVEAAGVYNDAPFSERWTIPESDAFAGDSLAAEIWAGQLIQSLESEPATNGVVSEIIEASVSERVLSLYSAFLCLEPNQGGEVMHNPWDESDLPIGVKADPDTVSGEDALEAFPNPFNDRTVIRVRLKSVAAAKEARFRIFNLRGQVVATLHAPQASGSGPKELAWDGRDDAGRAVSGGVYLFVMTAPQSKKSLKLVYLR